MANGNKRYVNRRMSDSSNKVELSVDELTRLTESAAKSAVANLTDIVDEHISSQMEELTDMAASKAIDHVGGMIDRKMSEEAENIAERASDLSIKKSQDAIYQTIGRNVVQKSFIIIGVVVVAALVYLQSKGYFVEIKD